MTTRAITLFAVLAACILLSKPDRVQAQEECVTCNGCVNNQCSDPETCWPTCGYPPENCRCGDTGCTVDVPNPNPCAAEEEAAQLALKEISAKRSFGQHAAPAPDYKGITVANMCPAARSSFRLSKDLPFEYVMLKAESLERKTTLGALTRA